MFIFFERGSMPKLHYAAVGIIACMVNIPQCDYVTVEELKEYSVSESIETIRQALQELIDSNLVFEIGGKYAVRKDALLNLMEIS